ncbi:MAG: LAGLIDADG family homing endonuclease [Christensenellales bacterium]
MAVIDYTEEIKKSCGILKAFRKSKEAFANERAMLGLMQERYRLYYSQIHKWLAPKRDSRSEEEIRRLVKEVFALDLPVCEIKIKRFQEAIEKVRGKKDESAIEVYYQYLQEWLQLYEGNYALVAFRSLEHWALFSEWDKSDNDKFWKYSIDTFGDNGWSGCTKGFFYYGNKMVLDNQIKFLMKQMPTSFGKCGHPLTKVRTPNGIKTLEELKVGDSVYSMHENKLCVQRVKNKWYNKKKQVKITTRGGVKIIVSPEHKLYTEKGYLCASELTDTNYLYRLCKKVDNGIPQDDDELMFASLMMFDGCCKYNFLSFTQEENEIYYEFIKLCERLGFEYRIRQKDRNNAKTIYVKHNNGKPNEILKKYGILDCLSKDKKMPNIILDLPIEQRYKFLGYMFATDGYIPYKKDGCGGRLTGITLASEDLAQGIQQLLNSCGIYSMLSYKKSGYKGKTFDAYVVQIPEEYFYIIANNVYCFHKQKLVEDRIKKINSFSIPPHSNNTVYPKELVKDCKEFKRIVRKQFARNNGFKRELVEKFNQETGLLSNIIYEDFVFEKIKSIEFIDEEIDMIDIEVENTHNFIANDLVSHNSFSDSVMISFIFGVDPKEQVIKVVGNRSLVSKCTKQVVDLMVGKRFRQVFPEYAQGIDESKDIGSQIFSICKIADGKFTINGSGRDTSFECFSKETDRDGIRGGWLFLDDIVQRSERMKLKLHQADLDAFDGTWKKRSRDEKTFRIVCSGTTYDIYDFLSELRFRYSDGKMRKSNINKWTTLNLDGSAVFVKVAKLDEKDQLTFPQKTVLSEVLKDRHNNPDLFQAMDMQEPLAPEGTPFYWDYIKQYEFIPSDASSYCYATLDPARTGDNYVSMPIFKIVKDTDKDGVRVDRHYLIDCIYIKAPMDTMYGFICTLIEKHNIVKFHIERNTDTSLKYLLDKMLKEREIYFCDITEVYSTKVKEDRILENETKIKNLVVFPKREMYGRASQMGQFMEHIISYKYKGADYDDSIDAVSMYIDKFVNNQGKTAKVKLLYI